MQFYFEVAMGTGINGMWNVLRAWYAMSLQNLSWKRHQFSSDKHDRSIFWNTENERTECGIFYSLHNAYSMASNFRSQSSYLTCYMATIHMSETIHIELTFCRRQQRKVTWVVIAQQSTFDSECDWVHSINDVRRICGRTIGGELRTASNR